MLKCYAACYFAYFSWCNLSSVASPVILTITMLWKIFLTGLTVSSELRVDMWNTRFRNSREPKPDLRFVCNEMSPLINTLSDSASFDPDFCLALKFNSCLMYLNWLNDRLSLHHNWKIMKTKHINVDLTSEWYCNSVHFYNCACFIIVLLSLRKQMINS